MLVAGEDGCPATDLPKGQVLIQLLTLRNRRNCSLPNEGGLLSRSFAWTNRPSFTFLPNGDGPFVAGWDVLATVRPSTPLRRDQVHIGFFGFSSYTIFVTQTTRYSNTFQTSRTTTSSRSGILSIVPLLCTQIPAAWMSTLLG